MKDQHKRTPNSRKCCDMRDVFTLVKYGGNMKLDSNLRRFTLLFCVFLLYYYSYFTTKCRIYVLYYELNNYFNVAKNTIFNHKMYKSQLQYQIHYHKNIYTFPVI